MNSRGQIRRSTTQDSPGTILQPGELAYSYLTGRLYIGAAEVGQEAQLVTPTTTLPPTDNENKITVTIT